jgi:two-component system, sporulation sensor kinase A
MTNPLGVIFWIILIAIDIIIASNLFWFYRKDKDPRKLMFSIGVLICTCIYVLAVTGIGSSQIAKNIFYWSPLPIELAFIFVFLDSRFHIGLKNSLNLFLIGTILSIALFFVPFTINSLPVIATGALIASVLAILQYSKEFDTSSVLLFLSMPSFTVCFLAIGPNLTELALFAGFSAIVFLLLAFEVAKKQEGTSSPILALKKQLTTVEQNFAKLFNMLPDPVSIVDAKGNFLAVTSNVTAITGFKKEELIGTNFMDSDMIAPESKKIMANNLVKRMLGHHIEPYLVELNHKDGRKLQVELNALKIEYDGKPADMVVFRDLSERNRLLKSLEREQLRFQSIAESSGDWIWELDLKGNYIYSNQVVEKILGYSAEDIICKNYVDFLAPSCPRNLKDFFEAFEGNDGMVGINKRCLHKNGQVVILETSGVPVYVDKKIVGYRGVDRDVTDEKEMQDRLLKSEKLAAIGQMATMVAHDLRNPLQGISTAFCYVKKATQNSPNDKMASVIKHIEDSIKYSNKILNELVDYSEDIKLEVAETNPHTLVTDALAIIEVPKNIKLNLKNSKKTKIALDSDRMRRVLINLISNAVESMPDGGTLTVASRKNKQNIEIAVIDTGTGIPDEKIAKLWTPFFTTKAKGMGLGLPICKRIVEAHGGVILVDTQKGKGTTFTLVLPQSRHVEDNVCFSVGQIEPQIALTKTK